MSGDEKKIIIFAAGTGGHIYPAIPIAKELIKQNIPVLWIGTDAGLCSYDGRELVIFDQNDGLPNNLVWAITESDLGEIWIGCYGGGIAHYDGSKFIDCSNNIPSKSLRTLYYENDLLHIGTDRHFIIYDGLEYTHSEDQFQTMKVLISW